MRQLNHDFKEVLARHPRERSFGARKGHACALDRIASALDDRFPRLRARDLKGRHVEFLVVSWWEQVLSAGTTVTREFGHNRCGVSQTYLGK